MQELTRVEVVCIIYAYTYSVVAYPDKPKVEDSCPSRNAKVLIFAWSAWTDLTLPQMLSPRS